MATMRSAYDVEDPTGLGGVSEGIKSLGAYLMPDPSKMLQGRYYGARARQAAVDTAIAAGRFNISGPGVQGMMAGGGPPGFTPTNVEGTTLMMPSLGATVAGGGGPAAQPTAGAQPSAPGPLSSVLMGGQAGGPPPAIMDPQRTADFVSNPSGPVMTGVQPPPMSPPSPGAPPAPNATGTDGSVPANDPRLHPGSVTEANGGVKMSGPAGPNGQPAPMALNMGAFMALAAQSGYDAATIKLMTQGYVNNLYTTGRISGPVRDEALSRLEMATVLTQQGETQREGMRIGEQRRQFDMAPTETVDAQGNKTYTPRAQAYGRQGYDSAVRQQAVGEDIAVRAQQREYVTVQDADGGTRQVLRRDVQPGDRVISQQQEGKLSDVISTTGPQGTSLTTKGQAMRGGLAETPTTPEQVIARDLEQNRVAPDTDKPTGADIRQRYDIRQPMSPGDQVKVQQARDEVVNRTYPMSTSLTQRNIKKITLTGEAYQELDRETEAIKRARPTLTDTTAANMALRKMQSEGRLPKPDEVSRPVWGNVFVNNITKDGTLEIGLKKPDAPLSDSITGPDQFDQPAPRGAPGATPPRAATAPTASAVPQQPSAASRFTGALSSVLGAPFRPRAQSAPSPQAQQQNRDMGAVAQGVPEGQERSGPNGIVVKNVGGRWIQVR